VLGERLGDVIWATGRLAKYESVEERIRAGRALVLKGAREKGREYEILIEAIEGVEADEVVAGRAPRRDIVSLLGYWADQARDWDYFCHIYDMGISRSMHNETMCAWGVYDRLAELVGRPLAETVADAVAIPVEELNRQQRLAEEWQEKITAEHRDEFYEQVMRYVRGEDHDLSPGTIGMIQADIAKGLIVDHPDLALPESKERLLQAIESAYNQTPVEEGGHSL
jgi:hypothetical protein